MAELAGPRVNSQFQPPPRHPSIMPLLGCGAVALILVVLSCAGLGFYLSGHLRLPSGDSAATKELPPEEDRQEILAAIDGQWHVPVGKHREMQQLLRQLENASLPDKRKAFEELVDWPAHLERFYSSYRFQPIPPLMRMQLSHIERADFSMPAEVGDFRIAEVVERGPDERMIYAYNFEGNWQHVPYRFLVRRKKQNWKLVDWCELPNKLWATRELGLGSGPTIGDLPGNVQRRILTFLSEVDTLQAANNAAEAERRLRTAEAQHGIPELRPTIARQIAIRWHILGNLAEAERVYRSAGDPAEHPWLVYGLAEIYESQQRHDQALEQIELYEQVAGFHASLSSLKTQILNRQKRTEAAAKEVLRLLRFDPKDSETLQLAVSIVPAERISEVLALLPDSPESIATLTQCAELRIYQDDVDIYQLIREHVAAKNPDGPEVLELDARLLHYQGRLAEAAAEYQERVQKLPAEEQRFAHSDAIELLLQLKSPLDVYRESTTPRQTIRVMVEGLDDDEILISDKQLGELLPLHFERDPTDPRLPYYAARVASEQQDFDTAIREFQKFLAAEPSADEEEYFRELVADELLNAYHAADRTFEGFRKASEPANAYRILASQLEQAADWSNLHLLNTAASPILGEDAWLKYYTARVDEEQGRLAGDPVRRWAALGVYQALRESKPDANAVSQYLLDTRIDDLRSERNGWRVYLPEAKAPAALLERLLTRFREEGDDLATAELLEQYEEAFPNDVAGLRAKVNCCWEQADHAGVVTLLTPWPPPRLAESYYQYELRQRLIVSLLHELKRDEALKLVEAGDVTNSQEKFYVALARQDIASATKLLAEKQGPHFSLPLESDWARVPAINRFLASEEFKQLTEDFPPHLSHLPTKGRSLLFFEQPLEWTADLIRERLQAVDAGEGTRFAAAVIVELPQPPLTTRTFELRIDGNKVFITVGGAPYPMKGLLSGSSNRELKEFQQAVSKHQAWLAIDLVGSRNKLSLEQIVGKLADKTTTGIWWQDASFRSYAAVLSATAREQLAAGERWKAVFPHAQPRYFAEFAAAEPATTKPRFWHSELRAAAAGSRTGEVKIRVQVGQAAEVQWLTVVRVKHQNWGHYLLDCRFSTPSHLLPTFREGSWVRINAHEILDWRP